MKFGAFSDALEETSTGGGTMVVLTHGLSCGWARRREALGEVDVAHVAAAAAEVVGAVLHVRRRVGHHAAVLAAALLVTGVGPATLKEGDWLIVGLP